MGGTFNRRSILQATAALALIPSTGLAQSEVLLKTIPASNQQVPAIGLGTWQTFDVGSNVALRRQRTELVRIFFELGGRAIDSSPMYGSSQAVVGHALSQLQHPSQLFAMDKVWIPNERSGPSQIDQTTRRWAIPQFDLLQVHNLVSWRSHLDTLFAMKANGHLRYVGITSYAGIRYDQIARIMNEHPIDFIQVTYNMATRQAEDVLLPLAQEKGIAVIANRPFQEGYLIDKMKRKPLPKMAAEIGARNWAQFLLKFIISHPALTMAIPATRRIDHLRENMGALTGPIPDQVLRLRMIQAFEAL